MTLITKLNESVKNEVQKSQNETEIVKNEQCLYIIVTGFGPFTGHEHLNASWEAVKLLPEKLESSKKTLYNIEKQHVSVTYQDVEKNVKEIWKKAPELVVHCGVHGEATTLHVERAAYNTKFNYADYSLKILPNSTARLKNNGKHCERLETALNVNEIVKNINLKTHITKVKENPIIVSNDVGNYLCGFIYLKSLDIDCHRTLFIHVPPINKPFSSEETSHLLLEIIQECIEEIEISKENN